MGPRGLASRTASIASSNASGNRSAAGPASWLKLLAVQEGWARIVVREGPGLTTREPGLEGQKPLEAETAKVMGYGRAPRRSCTGSAQEVQGPLPCFADGGSVLALAEETEAISRGHGGQARGQW